MNVDRGELEYLYSLLREAEGHLHGMRVELSQLQGKVIRASEILREHIDNETLARSTETE